MSVSGRSGAHSRAADATSQSADPGLARSKSISATARPPRKMTLSRLGSLWLTSPARNGGGAAGGQSRPAGSNDATAWW